METDVIECQWVDSGVVGLQEPVAERGAGDSGWKEMWSGCRSQCQKEMQETVGGKRCGQGAGASWWKEM